MRPGPASHNALRCCRRSTTDASVVSRVAGLPGSVGPVAMVVIVGAPLSSGPVLLRTWPHSRLPAGSRANVPDLDAGGHRVGGTAGTRPRCRRCAGLPLPARGPPDAPVRGGGCRRRNGRPQPLRGFRPRDAVRTAWLTAGSAPTAADRCRPWPGGPPRRWRAAGPPAGRRGRPRRPSPRSSWCSRGVHPRARPAGGRARHGDVPEPVELDAETGDHPGCPGITGVEQAQVAVQRPLGGWQAEGERRREHEPVDRARRAGDGGTQSCAGAQEARLVDGVARHQAVLAAQLQPGPHVRGRVGVEEAVLAVAQLGGGRQGDRSGVHDAPLDQAGPAQPLHHP